MTRLLLISGVRLYGEGLRRALQGPFDVCGVERDAASAVRALRELPEPPDIAVLDLTVPEGLDGLRLLRAVAPALKVVAFGLHERDGDVVGWVEAGARGFISREASLAEVEAVLEAVARGERPCSPQIVSQLMQRVVEAAGEAPPALAERRVGALTRREREIVRLIDEGLSNKQIASRLQIEVPTVKNHVHHALEKLEVSRRGEAAAVLRRAAP